VIVAIIYIIIDLLLDNIGNAIEEVLIISNKLEAAISPSVFHPQKYVKNRCFM
jgi:hypothetical protein